jgi:hypothetical protein
MTAIHFWRVLGIDPRTSDNADTDLETEKATIPKSGLQHSMDCCYLSGMSRN